MVAVNEIMSDVLAVSVTLGKNFLQLFFIVLSYPFDPKQRIFVLWLFTSLLCALFVFSRSLPRARNKNTSMLSAFLHFLFPKEVWSHASAWLDVRYFFFHQPLRVLLYEGTFIAAISTMVLKSSVLLMSASSQKPPSTSEWIWAPGFIFACFAVLLSDFIAYAIHAYQHKNPLLWEFHKIHHSAPVMHPFTNYREHPIDNLFYALGHGIAVGLSGGCISWCLGYVPETPTIWGIALFSFLFNALGYNLRHSHIWLRWPGKWSYVFGCPAHHQIHHSFYPDHIDKNFAFMFPVWDVLFGTFCLPNDNSKLQIGLGDGQEEVYRSCRDLYFIPLKNSLSQLKNVFLPRTARS